MSNKPLYETEYYIVTRTDAAVNETGSAADAQGYAVINRKYNIVEHTTTVLPAAMFQADNFNRTLKSLLEETSEEDAVNALMAELDEVEDVSIN